MPPDSDSPLMPHGGYENLRSYAVAEAVYDATVVFCDRFIDKTSRTHDQMVQAARSGVRNISEGSGAAATSKKMEMKLTNVARASMVAMMAGSAFIKTSTGKETSNATLPVGLVMTRMIREYGARTGHEVGFKPAGGIRTAKQALDWLILMKEELGDRWLRPHLFRFGASGLLTDVERQLEHFVTGRYAAAYRQPMV